MTFWLRGFPQPWSALTLCPKLGRRPNVSHFLGLPSALDWGKRWRNVNNWPCLFSCAANSMGITHLFRAMPFSFFFSSLPQKCHLACVHLGQLAGTRRFMAYFVLASRGFVVSRLVAGDFGGFSDHENHWKQLQLCHNLGAWKFEEPIIW